MVSAALSRTKEQSEVSQEKQHGPARISPSLLPDLASPTAFFGTRADPRVISRGEADRAVALGCLFPLERGN